MQIPSKSSDEFIILMNEKSEKIRTIFLEKIINATKSIPLKVMLGDSTVTEQTTFDPANVKKYFQDILKYTSDWNTNDISISNEKDLRRIFIKSEIREGNYILSFHMSLQYHALLYYKLDHRVIDIQKELAETVDKTKNLETVVAERGEQIVKQKLREIGYENVDQQKLFEIFFQNEEFANSLIDKIYSSTDKNFIQISKRKSELFKELDNMLIETYQTSPVLIDEMKMIAAEEGCLCHFNLEYVKGSVKEGNLDPLRISPKIKEALLKRMEQAHNAVNI